MADKATVVVDDKKLKLLFSAITQRAENAYEANKIISHKMREDVLNHFKTEENQDGKWPALSPATLKWKAKKGYAGMLKNTGMLRRGNLPDAGKDYARVYNYVEYAGKQNFGDGKVPARSFMWLSKKMIDKIVTLMARYIVRNQIADWT